MNDASQDRAPLEQWLASLGPDKPENLRTLEELRLPGWNKRLAKLKAELQSRIDEGHNVPYWRKKLAEVLEIEHEQRYGDIGRRGGILRLPTLAPRGTKTKPAVTAGRITDAVTDGSDMTALRQQLAEAQARIAELEAGMGGFVRTCATRPDARFHSNACRQAAYRERRGEV
jgi:hypothetical protein